MARFAASLHFASLLLLAACLPGCGSLVPTPENSAWTELANTLTTTRPDPTQSASLNTASWYLKVQAPDSPPALLAFGYLEPQTTPPTEVWFSGSGQYIKLRAGRIVATFGLSGTNWQNTHVNPAWPEWSAVSQGGSTLTRTRSTLPAYHFGIQEQLRIDAIDKPTQALASLMPGATDDKAHNWRWFRESVVSRDGNPLPPSLFATAYIQGTVVVAFSRQCLSEDFCLQLMRWPQLESEPHPW